MALHGSKWLEASWRNRESHVLISAGGTCGQTYPCENVCIEIRPKGWNCRPKPVVVCGCETEPLCPEKYMTVCASYIDDCGLHVFVWPQEVLTARQGMYEAVVLLNGCEPIANLPLRVGAHPGATYAEGPIFMNIKDCVKCDDPFDPCLGGCGCDEPAGNAPVQYVPRS